ncbi:MAG: TerB family tellurite resistance protein [Rhodoferax sp.]|uniref:tellurite resistance TerB family protein n=1 Tax=Rhodoferax sp. TaxID=50421 RepID=UPI00262CF76F|nr:TerB family tellurite resistance protein [Rhodoferax sp.]MDD2878852.1 TerB family tellurite resistance protein [Rhodoferax sp.]
MFSPFKDLLTQFFMPNDGTSELDEARSLQLATAALLVEMMRSDTTVTARERAATVSALRRQFGLSDGELAKLMAQAEKTAKTSNDYFQFTSTMNDHFTQPQKIQVVELMWQVAYADGHIDANENHLISKIAGLLHVTHGEYIAAKLYAKEAAQLASVSYSPMHQTLA